MVSDRVARVSLDVGGAFQQAAQIGDPLAWDAATAAYKSGAAAHGFRKDGLANDYAELRKTAPAIGRALAEQGDVGPAWVERLVGDEMIDLRCLAALVIGQVGQRWPQAIADLARRLGADSNWVVREVIANALDDGLGPTQGEFLFDLMARWATDPDANVRRVPTNALMRYGRHHPEEVAGLMRTLLHDESAYVRKNVAFCLGILGLEHHPTLGVRDPGRPRWLLGLLREWAADEDERARWIIAETLGRTWTKVWPAEALELLRMLEADERKVVKRQVAASIKAIGARGLGEAGQGSSHDD